MNTYETFSEMVKDELCKKEYDKDASYYILLAFIINNHEFIISSNEKKYIISTHFLANIRLIKKLFENINCNIHMEIMTSNIKTAKNKTKWIIEILDYEIIDKLFNNMTYDIKNFNDTQRQMFIVGAFLSAGSISYSLGKSNYHFEIRSRNKCFLNDLQQLFKKYNILTSIMRYRNVYKLYIKRSEGISDTLKLLGAIDSLYHFEDFRIQKDFSNSLQRINNLDISNINKTVIAANNQIKWINLIKSNYQLSKLDKKAQIFAEIRLANEDLSLDAISKIFESDYNIKISRSSLNHIVRRIEKFYNELKINLSNEK